MRALAVLPFVFVTHVAQALPSLSSMGYVVNNGNHRQSMTFQQDMARGRQISQAEHGCSWAVRPLIYVFSDGVVYANHGGSDYNVFNYATVRSHGCKIPDEPQRPGSFSELPLLSQFGWDVDNRNHPKPSNFESIMARGMNITQAQHKCAWAVRPLIYIFGDGVVYANHGGADYNVFDLGTVLGHGCEIPGYGSSPSSQSAYPSLASLGYAVDNANHRRPSNFQFDMSRGLQVSQAEHRCAWAVRPLIYVFPDGVVYATLNGDDYNVFDYNTVKRNGCYIPDLGTTPDHPSPPIEKPGSSADMRTLDGDTMALLEKFNSNMQTYQAYASMPIGMHMPELDVRDDAANTVSLYLPPDPDDTMNMIPSFTAIPSVADGMSTELMPEEIGTEDGASAVAARLGPDFRPPWGPVRGGRRPGENRHWRPQPVLKTSSQSHKWSDNKYFETGTRYEFSYYPGTVSFNVSGNGAIYGRILTKQADLVSVSARTDRDLNGTYFNVNDDKLLVEVTGKIYNKTYTIYKNTIDQIDKSVVINEQLYPTRLWGTSFTFAIGPIPFSAIVDLNATTGWKRGTYGWGLKTELLRPQAHMEFTPTGRFRLDGALTPGVAELNKYLSVLGGSLNSSSGGGKGPIYAATEVNLISGDLNLKGNIMPELYCRTVQLQDMSALDGRIYGAIHLRLSVVKVVNEVIGEVCKFDIFGICKSKAVKTIMKKIDEVSDLNLERDWYRFPGHKFPNYAWTNGCSILR